MGRKWNVDPGKPFKVWCDSSSVALAAVLECDDKEIEDGEWLRKAKDPLHINFAELVAVLKGVNMAVKWGAKQLEIVTDSSTVHHWLHSLATQEHRLRVAGDGEMLIRRRLELIRATLSEYGVRWSVSWVPSPGNKADPPVKGSGQVAESQCCSSSGSGASARASPWGD